MTPPKKATLLPLGLLVLAYLLVARLSLVYAISPVHVSPAWPVVGLAVAGCLIYGNRLWPAIFVGAALVAGSMQIATGTALLIALGHTLEAVGAVWLIKRYTHIETRFSNVADVFKFAGFGAISALLGALIGTTALLIQGDIVLSVYPQTGATWFLADLSGILIIVPAVIMLFGRSDRMRGRQRWMELVLFSVLFIACSIFVFAFSSTPLLFLFLTFSAWLAFRFSQVEVAYMNFFLALAAVVGTATGGGPIAALPYTSSLPVLQVFVIVVGVTGLVLAVTVEERRRSYLELSKMQEHLEQLIGERSMQLEKMIDALQGDIDMRERIQQELKAKEKLLEEAQHLARLGSWEWDMATDRMNMSDEMRRIYGVPPGEGETLNFLGYLKYIPSEESSLVYQVVQSALMTKLPFSYEHRVIRPNGEVRYLRCRGKTELDAAGRPVRLYGTAHDRTEEKLMETNLRETEELYRKVVEVSPNAIYLLHEGKCMFSNAAGLDLAGVGTVSELAVRPFLDFIEPAFRGEFSRVLQQPAWFGKSAVMEGRMVRLDNTVIDTEMAAAQFSIKGKTDILLVAHDVSERKKSEQQIRHLAHHDMLTGLANRVFFKERLEHAIYQSHRSGQPLAVLFIDLDRFKNINDTCGHNAGDEVLRACAQRLQGCLRESDTVARAGGDEFLVLMEAAPEPLNVPTVVEKILRSIRQPFYAVGKEFEIDASIGISICPADGDDVETLIKHADTAMYRAKVEGGSHFRYYLPSMTKQSVERYAIESSLRHALERGEMELYFQPKICLSTRCLRGAEALIRWNHPQNGLLLPDRFISIAEDMGLIARFGLWAIQEVCRHTRDWQQQGLAPVRIAVNLAYSQFADKSFCSKTEQLLRDFQVEPGVLELEITETMAMQHAESLMSTLHQLKRLGIHLSIDDFGTGYSSLAYLKRLPVDSVKVDRSFIKDLPGNSEDAAITHAVLALVHSLNRSVVAEGVETAGQLRFLIDNGCDEVQGFYFSPALPEKEFRAFLERESERVRTNADAWPA